MMSKNIIAMHDSRRSLLRKTHTTVCRLNTQAPTTTSTNINDACASSPTKGLLDEKVHLQCTLFFSFRTPFIDLIRVFTGECQPVQPT